MDIYKERYTKWLVSTSGDLVNELLLIEGNEKEIEDRFYKYLEFGTGGMRGLLGAGTNRVNVLTIRRVAEGLALFIRKSGIESIKRGVVIAYDTRHLSRELGLEVAKTLGKYGIRVYLFSENRPTPELSFAVRYFHAFAGVVITASHNPKEYNGIKLYGEDGGQLPPDDANKIVLHMETIEDLFSIKTASEMELVDKGLMMYVLEEVDAAYQNKLRTLLLDDQPKDKIKIVYSSLHGTGNRPVREGLRAFGFTDVHIVKEQELPDPNFTTVTYPNPEEEDAFRLAIKVGKDVGADLLMATDPDADRLGVAVLAANGEYELLTGNQLGALLLYFILMKKEKNGSLPENGVIMKTIVTSELGRTIAASYGIPTIDTLTGFKFISGKIEEFTQTNEYKFLFGYEESYGYLIGDFVRDKDAVQAALVTAEAAAYYKSIGKSLSKVLEEIDKQFGYYRESLRSITANGKDGHEKISRIMTTFREKMPNEISGNRVASVEDYLTQTVKRSNGSISKINLPVANVLKMHLEDGSWICIRPSGTEPKCKFYFGVKKNSDEEAKKVLELVETSFMSLVQKIM